jgi:L-ascorbate metabolism protein UlaG (beta-lactamase superfamily)
MRLRWKVVLGLAGSFLVLVAVLLTEGWQAFGHRAQGERAERMHHSPQWAGSHFENPQPLHNEVWGSLTGALHRSDDVSPHAPVPVQPFDAGVFATPPASGLRVTWLGHSSTLVELDGVRILTDPVWSERVSPYDWLGPTRWFPPPIPFAELPAIDAVVISHDHYDHLDLGTVLRLNERKVTFIVPVGLGAHLEYWGVPTSRIVELEWWQSTKVGAIEITCVPARHASGRVGYDYGATLWAGYALFGTKRVYFSGDTGLFPAMKTVGEKLGPFDLTMIEVGQYHQAWPDWHGGPEQAVRAHQWVKGSLFLPIHWGAFALAYHGWTEPIERALAEATRLSVPVVTPRPGQPFEPSSPPGVERWWPSLPFVTGAQDPIVSTQLE